MREPPEDVPQQRQLAGDAQPVVGEEPDERDDGQREEGGRVGEDVPASEDAGLVRGEDGEVHPALVGQRDEVGGVGERQGGDHVRLALALRRARLEERCRVRRRRQPLKRHCI